MVLNKTNKENTEIGLDYYINTWWFQQTDLQAA